MPGLVGYLTDDDLFASLRAILKPELAAEGQPDPPVASWILQTVSDCNVEAYGCILSVWGARRGYTPTQIAAVYQGPTRQRRIGLYLCAERLGLLNDLASYLGKMPDDPRKDLLTEDLTDSTGVPILPIPSTNPNGPGYVGSGPTVTAGRMNILPDETFRSPCCVRPGNPLGFKPW